MTLNLGRNSVGHIVDEVGEVGGSQEHASQVVQSAVLLVQSTVLDTQLMGFVGASSDFTLQLTNVLYK